MGVDLLLDLSHNVFRMLGADSCLRCLVDEASVFSTVTSVFEGRFLARKSWAIVGLIVSFLVLSLLLLQPLWFQSAGLSLGP